MKPLGHKAYGSIPHLPNSRMGPGEHHISPGQAKIATEAVRALGVVRAAIESSKRNGESVLLQEIIDKVGTGD